MVGLLNLALYYVLFNIFLTFGWHPLAANAASFVPVTLNSFALNKLWTFQDRQTTRVARQYGRFLAWTTLSLAIESGALALLLIPLEQYGRIGKNVAAGLTAPLAAVLNFLAQRRWTFAREPAA